MMDKDEGTYFTGSRMGDGVLGVLMAHLALAVFWIAAAMLMSLVTPYILLDRYGIHSMVTCSLLIAPTFAWGMTLWLSLGIKRDYSTCGRAFQITAILYGILFFGGPGGCMVIGALGNLVAKMQ